MSTATGLALADRSAAFLLQLLESVDSPKSQPGTQKKEHLALYLKNVKPGSARHFEARQSLCQVHHSCAKRKGTLRERGKIHFSLSVRSHFDACFTEYRVFFSKSQFFRPKLPLIKNCQITANFEKLPTHFFTANPKKLPDLRKVGSETANLATLG